MFRLLSDGCRDQGAKELWRRYRSSTRRKSKSGKGTVSYHTGMTSAAVVELCFSRSIGAGAGAGAVDGRLLLLFASMLERNPLKRE